MNFKFIVLTKIMAVSLKLDTHCLKSTLACVILPKFNAKVLNTTVLLKVIERMLRNTKKIAKNYLFIASTVTRKCLVTTSSITLRNNAKMFLLFVTTVTVTFPRVNSKSIELNV